MISLLVFSIFLSCEADSIIVQTSRGAVEGFDKDFGSDGTQRFYGYGQMFLGIPYAKPPLGEMRYKLTEDICQYNAKGQVHNATYYRPRCWQQRDFLQPADDMDEDCLYLNVYTPDVNGIFPVMFYIPGGGFTTGGGDVYHWKGAIRNLVSRGVTVVTINYRVGVIGFFTTFTENFPPNRGMYDMLQALQWVQEEIHNFGGDKSRVTIFGQSAGASAVSQLSLSPMARGLFHQLIQTSGNALLETETPEPARGSTHKARAQQICGVNDTDWGSAVTDAVLMDCLVNADPKDLIFYDEKDAYNWMPTLDGAFLPDYPENLAKIRPNYPMMAHDMHDEGASSIPSIALGDISHTGPNTIKSLMKGMWMGYDEDAVNSLSNAAIDAYSNGNPPPLDDHLAWAKLASDVLTGMMFDALFIRDIKWHIANKNDRVWLFTLTHESVLWYPIEIEGWAPVAHCADLPYLWYYPDIWETYNATDSDIAVANHIGRIWTDFAKRGMLTFPPSGEERNFIEIDAELKYKSNWRETTDHVFNNVAIDFIGEHPILTISDDSWNMLNTLGAKVKSMWAARTCDVTPTDKTVTSSPPSSTTVFTPTTSSTSSLTLFVTVIFTMLRLL